MMKRNIFFLFLLVSLSVNASDSIKDLFREMPDSLAPLLTKNNRLDMIDFREAQMKAVVTNLLEGNSEMTYLSDDSLSIRMNDALTIDMYIVKTEEEYDSCQTVICVKHTFRMNSSSEMETVYRYYSMRWRPINHPRLANLYKPDSTLLSKDNELVSKELDK